MARLTDEQREKILSDFHIGKSQNELAKKYSCSPATINKLCKGVIPKYKDKVNAVVSIKSELSEESEYQSECFDKEVNDQLRRKNLVFNATEKILQLSSEMAEKNSKQVVVKVKEYSKEHGSSESLDKIDVELDASDLKNLAETVDKSSITLGINQRHSNSQVVVNNQNNLQQNATIELSEEDAMKKALELGVPLSALTSH
jgi:predicted transcriptional regulator